MNLEEDEYGEYHIDLNQILNSNKTMALAKVLAAKLKEDVYMTMPEFLEMINDSDLKMLIDKIDENAKVNEDEESFAPGFEDILLMSLMMSKAEGLTIEGVDAASDRLNRFVLLLIGESLSRKGAIKFYREYATLGDDFDEQTIMESIK